MWVASRESTIDISPVRAKHKRFCFFASFLIPTWFDLNVIFRTCDKSFIHLKVLAPGLHHMFWTVWLNETKRNIISIAFICQTLTPSDRMHRPPQWKETGRKSRLKSIFSVIWAKRKLDRMKQMFATQFPLFCWHLSRIEMCWMRSFSRRCQGYCCWECCTCFGLIEPILADHSVLLSFSSVILFITLCESGIFRCCRTGKRPKDE